MLEEFSSLSADEQDKIIKIISDKYVEKSNIVALQKELNELSRENNLIRQQISSKFSKKEHQTISFQLGQGIIQAFKGQKKLKEIPVFGIGLFLDALGRKNGQKLTTLQKSLYPFVEYQDAFKKNDYKKVTVAILKSLINTLEKPEQKKNSSIEGGFKEIQPLKVEHKEIVNKKLIEHKIYPTKANSSKLKIACIMDEFTYFCFSPEAELLQLTPELWLNEISEFKPDFLFIESAWQGKESLWKSKLSQNSIEIRQLIKFCKMNAIKTMFWSKEDPVHFGTFIQIAKQADVVFTTDIDCIAKYKTEVEHDEVYLMPFAAQPSTHNPIEKYQRKDAFNFAGSFYLKYPERQRDFATLTDVASEIKSLDIYDRNYNNPHPHYEFPDRYKSLILGRLEPHEIDKAYKGYVYGINMNTIKQSQSMFARRVFEMLCSNTVVLSNYSRGVRNFFGDLVLCSDNKDELITKLKHITTDQDRLDAFRLLGLRKVLSEHTYEDRMAYILSKLKISYDLNQYHVNVIAKVTSLGELSKTLSMFEGQTYSEKTLLIFNPQKLEIKPDLDIKAFDNIESLNQYLLDDNQSYTAFFSSQDIYLKDYLRDLILSFKYLKDEDDIIVTKNSYFKVDNNQVVLVAGQEYHFVNQAKIRSSMIKNINATLLNQFLENDNIVVEGRAFSIDRFNYVEQATEISEEDNQKISAHLDNIEKGVKFKDKLLPFSEKIKALTRDQDYIVKLDAITLKDYIKPVSSKVSLNDSEQECIIVSELNGEEFEQVLFTPLQNIYSDNLEIKFEIDQTLSSEFIVKFYNTQGAIETCVIPSNELSELNVPKSAKQFNLSLRVKGNGQLNIKAIDYTFKAKANDTQNASEENSHIVSLSAEIFEQHLTKGSSAQIQFFKEDNKPFIIKTTLQSAKHAYMYMDKVFTREELNLVLNSVFELKAKSTAEDVKIVFEFQDEFNQKISHSMNPILAAHALAIPLNCKYIRLGLKIVGAGITEISSLDIGVINNPILDFIPKSDVLVVAKQYPSYTDLYKYGFLHTRLKAYKEQGLHADMFRVTNNSKEYGFDEFEGIDLVSHSHEMLDKLLASGAYKKVCIHLIDNKIWDVVKKYQDKVEVIIWIHGAEIQSWQRREFEFENFTDTEIVRQKKLSDQRQRFWKKLVLSELQSNTQFIFVSKYFRDESEQDLGIKFPDSQCHIIHNYIDVETFNYIQKNEEQRFKLLSIRPFASRKYANDLTVNAILELSQKPNFDKFEIAIYGDGVLFDELNAPLRHFKNVKLNKTFLTHGQISNLHKEYGVFIVPTRMDSQGVSRDEAMASGLVPVTTAVTAIPEFVDSECAVLVGGEDYKAIAEGIYEMSLNSELFSTLSEHAVLRVNQQCGFDQTIGKELEIIK